MQENAFKMLPNVSGNINPASIQPFISKWAFINLIAQVINKCLNERWFQNVSYLDKLAFKLVIIL